MGSAAPHVGQLKFDPLGAIEHGNAFAQPFPRVINRQTTLIPHTHEFFSRFLAALQIPANCIESKNQGIAKGREQRTEYTQYVL